MAYFSDINVIFQCRASTIERGRSINEERRPCVGTASFVGYKGGYCFIVVNRLLYDHLVAYTAGVGENHYSDNAAFDVADFEGAGTCGLSDHLTAEVVDLDSLHA